MRILLRHLPPLPSLPLTRPLHTYPPLQLPKPLPPLPSIPPTSITETFLKGSGPGGQKINKTNSAVQLVHHATGIVVKCQETRSRSQNRKIARRLLAERIEEVELGEGARTRVRGEVRRRRKGSAGKKRRRKYRRLAEGREGEGEEGDGEEEGEDGELDGEEVGDGGEGVGEGGTAEHVSRAGTENDVGSERSTNDAKNGYRGCNDR